MSDHAAFVQSLYAAFGRGDLGFILDRCGASISWESVGDPSRIPWSGTHTGRAGVTRFFQMLGGNVDFEMFEPGAFHVSGDTVLVEGRTRARHRLRGHGVFDSPWVHIFTITDGRLTRFTEYYDTAAIERALDA